MSTAKITNTVGKCIDVADVAITRTGTNFKGGEIFKLEKQKKKNISNRFRMSTATKYQHSASGEMYRSPPM